MSYTRTYTSSLHVSGSVSYPPSQHGGRTSYSQIVPIVINIHVDTQPFDQSVCNANTTIDMLTGSVMAMNAANCLSIKQNTDKVTHSLVDGFYALINSDVTMKRSECFSEIQAKYALLIQLSQDVHDKHLRMNEDIERLRAHYGSIFRDLDKDLEKRIKELDRQPFILAEKTREHVIFEPFRSEAASAASVMLPGGSASEKLSIARIRQKVSKVLNAMRSSVNSNLIYRHSMRNTLWENRTNTPETVSIPVAYLISDDLTRDQSSERYYSSDLPSRDDIISTVRSQISQHLSAAGHNIPTEEMEMIDHAFSSMVENMFSNNDTNDAYNSRVYYEILRMWNDNKSNLRQL